jgi:hypothetical protein
MGHKIERRLLHLSLLMMAASGCALAPPAERYDRAAADIGLLPGTVEGSGFGHRVYHRPGVRGGHLHVYLEGDGTPFIARTRIAADPTPRQPMTLGLMRRDPDAAVLVGRPCYHGITTGCPASLWTTARYSEAVVASMAAAIARVLSEGNHPTATLIGFSGGGAVAVLVAERLSAVTHVVTIAANLDIRAWTDRHGYTPLHDSINPADIVGTRSGLRHLHLTGGNDVNVPPALQQSLHARLPEDAFRTIDGFDHDCCWTSIWPAALRWAKSP